jgi:tRNA dimethylallyltransferase
LEIILVSEEKISPLRTWSNLNPLLIGIQKPKEELKKLIARRLVKRLHLGMLQEVRGLKTSGLSWKRLESFGLEYYWLSRYLQNKISRSEMISNLQKKIEQYAKRQMTWFKRDTRIHWVKNKKEAHKLASSFSSNSNHD